MAFSLGKARVDEIKEHSADGGYFPCHETTDLRRELEDTYEGWDFVPFVEKLRVVAKEQRCAGSKKWAETGQSLVDGD